MKSTIALLFATVASVDAGVCDVCLPGFPNCQNTSTVAVAGGYPVVVDLCTTPEFCAATQNNAGAANAISDAALGGFPKVSVTCTTVATPGLRNVAAAGAVPLGAGAAAVALAGSFDCAACKDRLPVCATSGMKIGDQETRYGSCVADQAACNALKAAAEDNKEAAEAMAKLMGGTALPFSCGVIDHTEELKSMHHDCSTCKDPKPVCGGSWLKYKGEKYFQGDCMGKEECNGLKSTIGTVPKEIKEGLHERKYGPESSLGEYTCQEKEDWEGMKADMMDGDDDRRGRREGKQGMMGDMMEGDHMTMSVGGTKILIKMGATKVAAPVAAVLGAMTLW